MTDPSRTAWRTSSYSNIGGECVEAATADGVVGVRDTKDRAGAVLVFRPGAWQRFTTSAKATAKS
jgi:Domain of unknown function (DUF397)